MRSKCAYGELMASIRLFLIEEQPSSLTRHTALFGAFSTIELCGSAQSIEDAIEKISLLNSPPHVVVCDIGLPTLRGKDTTLQLKALFPHTEIIILTVFEDENKVLGALEAGASGYLLKSADINKIREAIIDVYHGGTVIQPTLARKLLKRFSKGAFKTSVTFGEQEDFAKKQLQNAASLTTRELECLQIIAKGLSNQEVASVLNLSTATIRTHLEHIYQKLDASNRVEAITEGIRQGIIDL